MHRLFPVCATLAACAFARAGAPVFTDSFTRGASSVWRNEVGNWRASGGVYSAHAPSNSPIARSTLPFVFADCVIDVDINDLQDGGILLRSSPAPGTALGVKGVLLVTGGFTGTGTGLYWHVIETGNTAGSALNQVSGLFTPGASDAHITVTVVGDTYTAYVDGVLATTLTTDLFDVGGVGLYDFSNQTFDNVVVDGDLVCPSDLNRDLVVDAADLAILLGAWGQPGLGDLDGNGTTDAADLAILLGAWGSCT